MPVRLFRSLALLAALTAAGCAQKPQSVGGDITLASSPGATTTSGSGAPVRQVTVRDRSQPSSQGAGNASTTGAGVSSNVVFSSASGEAPPEGGDVVARADEASRGGSTSGSGESVFSSLMSFFKSDSQDKAVGGAASDTSAQSPGTIDTTGSATSGDQSRMVIAPGPSGDAKPLATTQSTSRVGLSPRSAGPSPIGQPPASGRVQSASNVPLSNNTIPWRVLESNYVKPGCAGAECPTIKVRRVVFSGKDRFNKFLDETLVALAELDTKQNAPFKTFAAFQKYFFTVARPKWEVVLEAGVRRDTPELVVVQLDSYVFSGGAHGASTTQYINWLPKADRLLTLETMILPKAAKQFEEALRRQHAEWLKTNTLAQENPAAYAKTWPFTLSDNVALLAEGLAVTYDPYVLAPYSYGRPTLVIPYSQLNGILRPELMPG